MVEYAKNIKAIATKRAANFSPKTVANALVMISEPGFTPKAISTPLTMTVRPVKVQIIKVSAKTSKIP